MPITSLKAIQKMMKKLEKKYSKTPEKAVIARQNIENKMQKLMDRVSWLRGKITKVDVREEHKKMQKAQVS